MTGAELHEHYRNLIAAYKALTEAGQYVTISCLPTTAEEEGIIWQEAHLADLQKSRKGASWDEYQAAKYGGDFTLHVNSDERERRKAEAAGKEVA